MFKEFNIYNDKLSNLNIVDKKKYIINTINPHSYITSKSDDDFYSALSNSNYLLPDGIGIVYAFKILFNKTIKKIAGADIHEYLLNYANSNKLSIFYLGASEQTLEKIRQKIEIEYPNITFGCYSPPFKPDFNFEDNRVMCNKINDFMPDILFIGMTAPKQEKWLNKNKNNINFNIATCIGAVFDFYAGTVERPSKFWINMGLEWFPRFLKEPKRLWRRNIISTPLFIIDIFKKKLTLK
ncbi:WecB/TagA/CpsF family glycosyltransferase [Flammeovirga sp. OC4]|uniref:WecB/TagA/CpsF family glycosyltransferase n=1 Tax=Flammeovirga sp. OC4 TaxID=1382345 RepID=UPI0005C52EF2|nr:WecB/TagA/CpsF family glycosyltransferase [Flammeovirga sp. OC4]